MRWIQGSSTWIRTSRVWPRHKHAHTRTHQRSAVSGGSYTLSSTGAKSYRHPQIMHLLYSRQRNTRHVPVSGPPSTEYFTTTPSYYLTLPWKTNPGCVTSGMGWFHANTEHDTHPNWRCPAVEMPVPRTVWRLPISVYHIFLATFAIEAPRDAPRLTTDDSLRGRA